ncbi:MAG: DNA polymerase III subunit gamma/tau [Ruminococcaceae bacterium]|nr:DNA polymerase III subunit gamma/tau [Oscillospiraceae bacterium]
MSQYMALYRKYRPSVFADVVGQDHITKVLRSEIMQGAVSHAYLFCGSRGTGKTTCAKILAKAISCENPKDGDPCGICEKCKSFENSFDIVEMDAASNNGVDDVRELREKINFMPVEMKRRVYIIDEVHMLSIGAFNALLKTLEEPPEHAMFILATTELNKIPATILSRCKRFDFHRISADDIVKRLEYIAKEENIGIDKDALKLISVLATGAMRDALSMLELFVGGKDITREVAEKSLGVVGNEVVLRLLRQIADKDAKGALETVSDSYNSSKDPGILCSELGDILRDLLVMKYASTSVSVLVDKSSDVIEVLRDVEDKFTPERLLYCTEIVENAVSKLARSGLSRRTVLEIMVMRLCDSRLSSSPEAMLERISALESAPRSVAASAPAPVTPKAETKAESEAPKVQEEVPAFDDAPPFDFDDVPVPTDAPPAFSEPELPKPLGSDKPKPKLADDIPEMIAYGDILEEIKVQNMILYSMLTDSRGYLDNDVMTVKVNPMALFMIDSDNAMKQVVVDCASKILGYPVTLNLVEDGGDNKKKTNDDFPFFG